MVLPTVNYHYLVSFGLSSVNFFALVMGLFMFVGIGQYLIRFFDGISKYYLNNKNFKKEKKFQKSLEQNERNSHRQTVGTSGDKSK